MKSRSMSTMPRNTAMSMRQACFGRMDLGMGFLRPGSLWSLWGCSYGRKSVREQTRWEPALGKGDHRSEHCTPVLHAILTGLGSTRQATLLKWGPRKAGPEPGDRMSYLTQLLFLVGFP